MAACFEQTCDQTITGRQFEYEEALSIIQEERYLEDADIDDIRRNDLFRKLKGKSRVKRPAPAEDDPCARSPADDGCYYYSNYYYATPAPAAAPAAQAGGALAVSMVGMLGMTMMMAPNFQQSGQVSGSAPTPGAVGGGGSPFDSSILTLAASLALIPGALNAVAVFPPFATPRRIPAIAVIFAERRNMAGTIRKRDIRRLYHQIRKRNTYESELPSYSKLRHAVRNIWPQSKDVLTKAWNTLSRFRVWMAKKMYKRLPRSMKKIVKKVGRIEARLHKKLVCMQPRLKRKYGRLIYPEGLSVKAIKEKKTLIKETIEDFKNFVKHGNAEDEHVEYIEDCFDDMDRPKFGFRVKIMLKEKEPCQINFENPEQSTCNLPSNGTSNADNEGLNRLDNTGYYDNYYYAHSRHSRQASEGFRSAAPPDCRIELCRGQAAAPADDDDDYYSYDEIRVN